MFGIDMPGYRRFLEGPRDDLVVPRPLADSAGRPGDEFPRVADGSRGLIYLIGSLRNQEIPAIGNSLRQLGYDVFDEWHAAGPAADDEWRAYELKRGHDYRQALAGRAARHVFEFDKLWLDRADIGVLVMPAGKSAHLELGYLIGQGKRGYILLDGEPERYDVMTQFAHGVFLDVQEMTEALA